MEQMFTFTRITTRTMARRQSAARKENLKKAQLAAIAARQRRKKTLESSISGQKQNPPLVKETVPGVRDGEPESTIGVGRA